VKILDPVKLKCRELLLPRLGEKKYKTLMQFIRFGCIGLLNTAVDTGIFSLMFYIVFSGNKALQWVAFVLGYACGTVFSFIFNKTWTFKDKQRSVKQALLFLVINLVTLGAGNGILKLLETANIIGIVAKIITIPFTTLMNFIGNKLFVFKS
jgi:putative flippase GtrA